MFTSKMLPATQVSQWVTNSPKEIIIPGRGGSGAWMLYDNFNRVTTSNAIGVPIVGGAPTYHTGSWTTDGDMLQSPTAEGVISWDTGVTTYAVECVIGGSTTGIDSGMVFRCLNNLNFMMAYFINGNFHIYTRSGGSYSSVLANFGTPGWAAGDAAGVVVTPSTVKAYRKPLGGSWSYLGEYLSGTFGSYTRVGFRTNNSLCSYSSILVSSSLS